jgi:hypothetical protein
MLAALALAASLTTVQAPPVRLAAPEDCRTNPNCAPGLQRVYGLDPGAGLVRLTVADAGIQALDDGLAEVAVAFSSNLSSRGPTSSRCATTAAWSAPTASCRSSAARCYGATGAICAGA